ncbi:MAG: adenylate/guanylate cyclase domain-containing protein [Rhodospirillaceae bacterium]|nr:adenylate/guanylate cyclase domain-containing protein [Rhodospirillaceae bacterium]
MIGRWASRLARAGWFDRGAALLLLALFCLVRIWDPEPVDNARVKVFDLYQNLGPSQNAERPAVIVDVDDASLAALGQWPWPRTMLVRLLDRLQQAGAVAVGFDIIFAERDRNSPAEYAASMPELPGTVREALQGLPNNDDRLAQAFGRIPVVLPLSLTREARADEAAVRKPPVSIRSPLGVDALAYLIGADHVLSNVPALQKAARGTGLITYYPESDGVVRRVPAIFRVGKAVFPSLAVELIRVATGGGTLVVKAGRDGIESIVFTSPGGSAIEVPTDRRGRLWVHFSPHDPKRYVSAVDVLSGKIGRAQLEGRLILIGTSAIGLQDIKATSIERQIPGVEIHAQLIENILFQDNITRPFYADGIEFFATVALSLLLIAFLPVLGAWRTVVSGAALTGVIVGAAWLAYSREGLLFDLTFPLGTSFAVFLLLAFFNYFREERQRRQVRSAFGRYLAPTLVERLAADPARLRLGGELRPMSLLFSDVRGFTSISERFDAAGLTAFMNRYLTPMTEAILGRGGTVDKYIGDAIMAFWNAPLDDPDHAANACRAALEMIERLAALNAELAAEAAAAGTAPVKIAIGIGINSAECCVGNMGSQQRFDYSVLGDGVNLAARLEGQTKYYGVTAIVGEDTQAAAPGFAMLEIDLIRVKGKTKPTRIYALLGGPDRAASEAFRGLVARQAEFLAAYRRADWDVAETMLADIRVAGGEGLAGPCAIYAARIAQFRLAPPPADWDGVYTAETK